MRKYLQAAGLFVLTAAVIFWTGCEERSPSEADNQPPVVEDIYVLEEAVHVDDLVTVVCIADDADGDDLTYDWFTVSGDILGPYNQAAVQWQAPSYPGLRYLRVTVSDGEDYTADSIGIEVLGYVPVIQQIESSPDTVYVNGFAMLTCTAFDPDGDAVIYTWSAASGSFTGGNTGSSVIWQAPLSTGMKTIYVTVDDGDESVTGSITAPVVEIPGLSRPAVYYPFNGNSEDISGNGFNAGVHGGMLTEDRFGNVGSAYLLDGDNDYISCSWFSGILFDYSVSLWVYPVELPEAFFTFISGKKGIFTIQTRNFGYYNGSKSILLMAKYSNSLDACVLEFKMIPSDGSSSSPGILTSDVVIGEEEWYHLTAVRRSGDFYLYLNGELAAFGVEGYSDPIIFESDYIDLGQMNCYGGNWETTFRQNAWWEGKIDDVRVYDFALEEGEITELYGEGGWTGE